MTWRRTLAKSCLSSGVRFAFSPLEDGDEQDRAVVEEDRVAHAGRAALTLPGSLAREADLAETTGPLHDRVAGGVGLERGFESP